jgi:hypothetical protein
VLSGAFNTEVINTLLTGKHSRITIWKWKIIAKNNNLCARARIEQSTFACLPLNNMAGRKLIFGRDRLEERCGSKIKGG